MNLSILYRGPLSSCNYGCDYCPFAKTKNTRAELAEDERQLKRFVNWIGEQSEHTFEILFTPWGEALIRRYYQKAIVQLSHMPNVRKVAAQTNLSFNPGWLTSANNQTTALWTTYHPSEVSRESFVSKCHALDTMNIRYSVGVVGFRDSVEEIQQVRDELLPSVYLWVNAYKRESGYYQQQDVEAFRELDRLFDYNNQNHESYGKACRTGHRVFSVNGEGVMTRCHFIKTTIGNIYDQSFEKYLSPKPCSNQTCGCHIGYIHMDDLKLDEVFQDGMLERIPAIKAVASATVVYV